MKFNHTKYYYLFLLALMILGVGNVQAQTYGNEWINYSQQYYKIPVVKKGVYKISYAQLQSAGIPIASVKPKNLQIFHRGKEQAIVVNSASNEVFSSSDYVLFYGEKNDGTQDALMYKDPTWLVNKYYNLYSDTTAYFLTWTVDGSLGKRMIETNESNIGGLTAESYHWKEELLVFNNQYALGRKYPIGTTNNIYISDFDIAEGWVGSPIGAAGANFNFNVNNINSGSGVKPKIEIRYIGRNPVKVNNTKIYVGNSTGSLRLLDDVQTVFQVNYTYTKEIELSDISGTGQVVVRLEEPTGSVSVAYVKLTYPQTVDMQSQASYDFRLRANGGGKSYLEISNPVANAQVFDITDKDNVGKVITGTNAGNLTAIVNSTTIERQLYVRNNTLFDNVIGIEKTPFINIDATKHNYLIVTHASLRQPTGGVSDPVQAYAAYRASTEGGGFDTLTVNVKLLYNQFNYGEYSPLAIKNFAHYIYDKGNPKFLFLIGKGLSIDQSATSLNPRIIPAHRGQDLIPPFGYPPSDVMYTAGFNPASPQTPMIPTGRLSTRFPSHVLNYLNKVKEHEVLKGEAIWMKNFIHLSGGNNASEQKLLRAYVDFYAQLASGGLLTPVFTTLSKNTSQLVEVINVSELVNQGVGVMTFFGHSAVGVTDLEIGFVTDDIEGYRNKGKYPMIIANGCQLASIFNGDFRSLSEDWINTADRGSIGFLAHTYIGYTVPLWRYSQRFYAVAFNSTQFVGRPVGEIIQEVIRTQPRTNEQAEVTVDQQMLLQGDPAIRLSRGNKPDYYTSSEFITLKSFDGNPLSAVSDSFQVNVVVANVGIKDNQPFRMSVERTYADGTSTIYTNNVDYSPINLQDTVSFTVKRDPAKNGSGLNKIKVHIDYLNNIDEVSETNNIAEIEYLFQAQGAVPLSPYDFSIANKSPIDFTAFSGSLTNENRQFVCEIDTLSSFDSPGKKTVFIQPSLLLNWSSEIFAGDTGQDSTVYYWRINYADQIGNPNPTSLWADRSFTYIPGSPEGWSQSEFSQFEKDIITGNLQLDKASNQWKFKSVDTKLAVNTSGSNAPSPLTQVMYNGIPLITQSDCAGDQVIVMAFKKETFQPYLLFTPSTTNPTCGRNGNSSGNGLSANVYSNAMTTNLKNYLDAIPSGDYVLLLSKGNVTFSSWDATIKTALQNVGASSGALNTLQNGHPYILLGQKGGSALQEVISTSLSGQTSESIVMNYNYTESFSSGEVTTLPIGPAKEWGKLYGKMVTNANDVITYQIIGINTQGQESVVFSQQAALPSEFDLKNILNAGTYPFIRLKLVLKDEVDFTPAQLKRWMVTYEALPIPEGLIDIETIGKEKYVIADKQEGESVNVEFAFRNITDVAFSSDSLWVRYVLTTNNKEVLRDSVKILAPQPKSVVRFSRQIETLGRVGANVLTVYVNPRIAAELYYDNNLYQVNFNVLKDNANPILEVSFDGRQIMDGEIVSPSPVINIRLRDENSFKVLTDTSNLNVLLRKCETCDFETIVFSDPNVKWTSGPSLTEVEFHPKNLENGKYALKVQGRDASDNKAGVNPYTINFEVVNESTVTHVFPYPNPFSTKTQFVFTLTGGAIPDEMKIQIMTVTGKVVREITKEELGPIVIGNNRSQYAWDGRDEYGDLLANGLYLYRVVMKINGQPIEQRKTSADKAFKNGFGKLYILR
ncbi:C25 family cysteine peptidase [uncultured Microscilla sp.]|uniref:putative type IX secretion system sortase PorU2 n=1 Tax=uncultured Microscilla sp. TaxID=432653 RepID=UPI0026155696|nr:C25 family cysteine peptidase [uncultured Microscilla sp.]